MQERPVVAIECQLRVGRESASLLLRFRLRSTISRRNDLADFTRLRLETGARLASDEK